MFWKAICDNLGTIIGVIGSLLGAIIGWWLNNITRSGKLAVYVENGINGEFVTEDNLPATSLEGSQYFNYKFNVEIYNSSSDAKLMRDIKLSFCNNSKQSFNVTPYDKSRMISGMAAPIHKPVELFNIPPKTAIRAELYGYISKEHLSKIFETTAVYLSYRDERNNYKKILVEKFEYSNYKFCQGK